VKSKKAPLFGSIDMSRGREFKPIEETRDTSWSVQGGELRTGTTQLRYEWWALVQSLGKLRSVRRSNYLPRSSSCVVEERGTSRDLNTPEGVSVFLRWFQLPPSLYSRRCFRAVVRFFERRRFLSLAHFI
jgi:hypothetical protein